MHSKPTLNTEMDALLDFYGLVRSNTIYKAQTVRLKLLFIVKSNEQIKKLKQQNAV